MANTPEGRVKAKITKWLRESRIWYCMPIGSAFMSAGVPDIICCYHGWFVALEVKAPGKEKNTTKLQDFQLAAIRDCGGLAIVVSSLEEAQALFNSLGDTHADEGERQEL